MWFNHKKKTFAKELKTHNSKVCIYVLQFLKREVGEDMLCQGWCERTPVAFTEPGAQSC